MILLGVALGSPFLMPPFSGDVRVSGIFDHQPGAGVRTARGQPTWGRSGHRGYDFVMRKGTAVFAAADGVVIEAGNRGPIQCRRRVASQDIRVRIKHHHEGQTYITSYLHLSTTEVVVGQTLSTGDKIGSSGNTGCSSGAHLHFGVWRQGWRDPWEAGLWLQTPALFREIQVNDPGALGLRSIRIPLDGRPASILARTGSVRNERDEEVVLSGETELPSGFLGALGECLVFYLDGRRYTRVRVGAANCKR